MLFDAQHTFWQSVTIRHDATLRLMPPSCFRLLSMMPAMLMNNYHHELLLITITQRVFFRFFFHALMVKTTPITLPLVMPPSMIYADISYTGVYNMPRYYATLMMPLRFTFAVVQPLYAAISRFFAMLPFSDYAAFHC